jgi:hypothetical protein
MRKGMRMEIGDVGSVNKNLGGEKKRKNENKKQNDSDGGNSNRAVFGVFSGYTRYCR